jgi:glycerate kinase
VGELILAAARLGASEVVVGCGGSATSDGGLGCYQVLREAGGLPIPVIAATDIDALFSGARRYAAQKGVRSQDLVIIDERLSSIRDRYLKEQGVDVELLERAGAAGGIAGALASLGATLVSGFDAVSSAVGLPERIESAQLVITGEGRFDSGSLEGKVTVGMAQLAAGRTPVLVVCGSVDDDAAAIFSGRFPNSSIASLERRFGLEIALNQVLECAAVVVKESLQN